MSEEMWIPKSGLRARFFKAVDEMMGLTNWHDFNDPSALDKAGQLVRVLREHDDKAKGILCSPKLFTRWTMLAAPAVWLDPDEFGNPDNHEAYRHYESAMNHGLDTAYQKIRDFNSALKSPRLLDLAKAHYDCISHLSDIEEERRKKFETCRTIIEQLSDEAHNAHAASVLDYPELERGPNLGKFYQHLADNLGNTLDPASHGELPSDETAWPDFLAAAWTEKHEQIKKARGSVTINVSGFEIKSPERTPKEKIERMRDLVEETTEKNTVLGFDQPFAKYLVDAENDTAAVTQYRTARHYLEQAEFSIVFDLDYDRDVHVYSNSHPLLHFHKPEHDFGGTNVILFGEIVDAAPDANQATILLEKIDAARSRYHSLGLRYAFQSALAECPGRYAFCFAEHPGDEDEETPFEIYIGSKGIDLHNVIYSFEDPYVGQEDPLCNLIVFTTSMNAANALDEDSPTYFTVDFPSRRDEPEQEISLKTVRSPKPINDEVCSVFFSEGYLYHPEKEFRLNEWANEDVPFDEKKWTAAIDDFRQLDEEILALEKLIKTSRGKLYQEKEQSWLDKYRAPYFKLLQDKAEKCINYRTEIEKLTKFKFDKLNSEYDVPSVGPENLQGRWFWLADELIAYEKVAKDRRKYFGEKQPLQPAAHSEPEKLEWSVSKICHDLRSIKGDEPEFTILDGREGEGLRWKTVNGELELNGIGSAILRRLNVIVEDQGYDHPAIKVTARNATYWKNGRANKAEDGNPSIKKAFADARNTITAYHRAKKSGD